jgi:hypothetical protein
MTNTPGKPQGRTESDFSDSQEAGAMSTTNVTPSPGGKGKQQKNSNEHIALVLLEAAAKITRKLSAIEEKAVREYAVAADHEVTADELLKVINEPVPQRPGNGRKKRGKFEVTADLLIRDIEELLGRELTTAEQGTIQGGVNDLRGDTQVTKASYAETVRHYGAEFKAEAAEAALVAQLADERANPPLERWTTQATELGTKMSSMLVAAEARVGTFKAMFNSVDQVKQNFIDLKDAIDAGRLPDTARIMPTYSWKKKSKDGKTTIAQQGFVNFQDYCLVILKRGKSAVYQMLKDAKMPREKKDPDNSLGAVIKHGAKSFVNLHKKLSDKDKKETSFDRFMDLLVAAARAIKADELAADREKADQQPVGETTANVGETTVQGEVLPPSQGQAE